MNSNNANSPLSPRGISNPQLQMPVKQQSQPILSPIRTSNDNINNNRQQSPRTSSDNINVSNIKPLLVPSPVKQIPADISPNANDTPNNNTTTTNNNTTTTPSKEADPPYIPNIEPPPTIPPLPLQSTSPTTNRTSLDDIIPPPLPLPLPSTTTPSPSVTLVSEEPKQQEPEPEPEREQTGKISLLHSLSLQ